MEINIEDIKVKNMVFANPEESVINMDVLFVELGEFLPFSANPLDPVAHGREIFKRAIEGVYGEIAPYVRNEEEEILRSTISFQEFRNRFTREELVAIRKATMEIPELFVIWEDFQIYGEVTLLSNKVKEDMNLFYTHKVLTKKRISELLKV